MQIRNTKLAAMAVAAGLLMWAAAPLQAACDSGSCTMSGTKTASATDNKPVMLSKFSKRTSHASRKVRPAHAKTAWGKSGTRKDKTATAEYSDAKASEKLPSWFLNANAALPGADPGKPSDDQARNIAATDDNEIVTMDGVQIASAEQLNDIDRAVADDKTEIKSDESVVAAPAPVAPQGRILRPVPSGDRHVIAGTDSDPWSKTSLIGKIFIAFGSLLTVASAARMLIA